MNAIRRHLGTRAVVGSLAMASALLLAACTTTGSGQHPSREDTTGSSASKTELAGDLQLRLLAEGVWVHVSTLDLPGFGRVPSNGLVVFGPDGALLVDTPWTPEQTEKLVRWIEERQPLVNVVVTHAHQDRTGGVGALPRTARVHALGSTVELSAGLGRAFSAEELPVSASLELAGERVETFFPGAGHAPDNLIVWFPDRRILFGGCMVKSADAGDLGNVADADIDSWGAAVRRVRERYPNAAVVVPGHGELGGSELLDHTDVLIKAAPRRP